MLVNGLVDGDSESEDSVSPAIHDLAKALLQIEQGVDPKYLSRPLGIDTCTYIAVNIAVTDLLQLCVNA